MIMEYRGDIPAENSGEPDEKPFSGRKSDYFGQYLSEIGRFSVLTLEEESDLVKRCSEARNRYLRKTFESGIAVNCAVNLIEKVMDGDIFFKKVFETELKKDDFIMHVSMARGRLNEIIEGAQKDYSALISGKTRVSEKERLAEMVYYSRMRYADIVMGLNLKTCIVKGLSDDVAAAENHIGALEEEIAGYGNNGNGNAEKLRQAKRELRCLDVQALESHGQLRERVSEIKEYCRRFKELRDGFLKRNLRLVVSIAKRYKSNILSPFDLIQEGNIALMTAFEKYECGKGARFSTYATWWIKQAIRRAFMNQGRTIRLSSYAEEHLRDMRKVVNKHLNKTGRNPTQDELAAELDITVDKVRELLVASKSIVSLDNVIDDEGRGSTLGDFIEDHRIKPPEEQVFGKTKTDDMREAFDSLTETEIAVLNSMYQGGYTLEEVGTMQDLTRERIRQIKLTALRKLGHPKRARLLQSV